MTKACPTIFTWLWQLGHVIALGSMHYLQAAWPSLRSFAACSTIWPWLVAVLPVFLQR